ncbi:hypothetical protein [Marinobacterium iners]|uniref:Uncharacterized protein n=1 Tax=Marinobacterium iners DSM 11526 TaxID=1122198 RepID=A0A1H4H7F9_9GAMM|nr:hypothetical protein [Marinobacterium iners]SEB17767.1 hypothetical protein SAMN02745729_1317 [Marinobacterium iners DSM 11526]
MPKLTPSELRLKKLKRLAHHIVKQDGLPKHEALEQVAHSEGFSSWRELKRRIIFNSNPNEENISAQYFHETGGNNGIPPEGMIGVERDENGEFIFKHRESHLSFVNQDFKNASDFRSHIESKIREIISNSKQHFLIAVKVYIDNDTASLIKNPDSFFPAIVNRYDRLHVILLEVTDTPLTYGSFNQKSIFEELYGPMPGGNEK